MRAALALLLVLAPLSRAMAAYSAPLTRVRIDSDRVTHTPMFVYVRDESGGETPFDTSGLAAQYVLQLEWASGLGIQAGLLAGQANVTMRPAFLNRNELEATGVLYGGQLRGYYTLWASGPAPSLSGGRPHALTAFVNLRVVSLRAGGEVPGGALRGEETTLTQTQVGGGVGAMAELALGNWVSLCPYAWFSPLLHRGRSLTVPSTDSERTSERMNLTRPLRTGADVWIYTSGPNSESHVALSAIVSLVDTSGEGKQESAIVVSYSFAGD